MTEINVFDKSCSFLHFDRDVEFTQLKDSVYVDHAGTTLYSKSQIEAYHAELLSNLYGNPHSRSQSSRLTADVIDQIRYRVLQFFNTTSEHYTVIFTSGCTGALKLIAESFIFETDCSSHGNTKGHNCEFVNNQERCNIPVIGKESELCDTTRHHTSTCSRTDFQHGGSLYADVKVRKGCFAYLLDNHTSVQGMREIIKDKVESILCIEEITEKSFKEHLMHGNKDQHNNGNSLFVYPAQSNYCGRKYPLEWTKEIHEHQMTFQGSFPGRWFVLQDVASYASTSHLDLSIHKPDFVTLSFYKMFGFPTGLGAVLVRNDSAQFLNKIYFGGGTVAVSSPVEMFHINRTSLSDSFEDGTVSFLDIISLRHGFDALDNLGGGIKSISLHTFTIAQYFHHQLQDLHHGNCRPVADIYCHGDFSNPSTQGPIVNFNLMRQNGSYIGFAEVDKMAQLYNIHLRTGCFCNIGACQKYLGLSSVQIKENFVAGHVCGDDKDLINGQPTGSVRVSFGYMSTIGDAQHCLKFICDCFVENPSKSKFISDLFTKHDNEKFTKALLSNEKTVNTKCRQEPDSSMSKLLSNEKTVNTKHKQEPDSSMSKLLSNEKTVNTKHKQEPDSSMSKPVILRERLPGEENIICDFKSKNIRDELTVVDNKNKDLDNSNLTASMDLHNVLQRCSPTNHVLTNICLYPVKSCGPFEVTEWEVCDTGLLYDRQWMIVSENGVTISQKREPKLCLIKPNIDLVNKTLTLTFPDMCSVTVPVDNMGEGQGQLSTLPCVGKVCGDRITGKDCGDTVGRWISKALQKPGCRLIQQNKADSRTCRIQASSEDTEPSSKLSLANESQYLLISRQSVIELQHRIYQNTENLRFEIENLVQRFRANIVIGGGHPFTEDSWRSIQIGKNKFVSQGGCSRCQMVCLDQLTGDRSKEPLRTLAVWRGKKIPFGIHLRHERSTVGNYIKVGDVLTVH